MTQPRIAYWCTSFEKGMEAVANEVATLRDAFPGSALWGVTGRTPFARLSRHDGLAFNPALQLLMRGVTRLLQMRYEINHVFGGLDNWFHLRALRDKPAVMTLAVDRSPTAMNLLNRIDRFVVEWPGGRQKLEALGIESQRISLIYPPVNLEQFVPRPEPVGPFTVLFASSPEPAGEIEARGVDLIIEAARRRPQWRFCLLWRPWGDALPRIQHLIEAAGVSNVALHVGRCPDMAAVYPAVHATVFVPRNPMRCKPSPNSLAESMACARPVVASPAVGMAPLIESEGSGLIADDTVCGLVSALETIEGRWNAFARRARRAAERHFDQRCFVEQYRSVYEAVLHGHRRTLDHTLRRAA